MMPKIVEVAEDRDEVRNEVDRAQRISRDRRRDRLGVPGDTPVPPGDPQGDDVALQRARPLLQAGNAHRGARKPQLMPRACM